MKTKEQHAQYMRDYFRNQSAEERKSRLEKSRLYRSRPEYKQQRRKYDTKYNSNNIDKVRETKRSWNHNNPEKRLEINIRAIKKFALPLDKSIKEVRSGLYNFRKCVLLRDNGLCQVSIQPQDQMLINSITGINSMIPLTTKAQTVHHLLYKSVFPQLAFNLNNGVSLSKDSHIELHSLNDRGYEI